MAQEDPEIPAWLNLFAKIWPMLLVLAGLIWATVELRVRKLIRQASTETKESLRRELQQPIADVGMDAMKALDRVNADAPRLARLETKMSILWRMIERSTADLLKKPDDFEDADGES